MSTILRAVLSTTAATALSRITGFVRTTAFAAILGTGVAANAFGVAAGLPTMIYDLFMGGILWSIFVPLLVERLTNHGEEDARRFVSALLTLILPFLAALVLLGIVFAGPLVELSTNWNASKEISPEEARRTKELAVWLFRFFVLNVFFYGIGTVGTGVLNAHRRFFLPTFAPVLNNLFAISCLLGFALLAPGHPKAAVYLLAATTFGVAAMSLVLLPSMRRLGYRPRPVLGHPSLLHAAKLSGPMLVFVASGAGVVFVATLLSTSFFAAPQIGYAFAVFSLPYGIFVIALETALMPELSERRSRGDEEGYRDALSFGLRTMAFVVVPASVGLVALAEPIVGLLYERGNFFARDAQVVANLLVAYSVGLLPFSAYFLLVRAFYSRQDTKTPALLNLGLFVLYASLAYGLSRLMGVVGVALAYSATSAVFALLGLAAMRREAGRLGGRRLLHSGARILVAGAAMYAVAWGGTATLGDGSSSLGRAFVVAVVGSASLVAYLGTAYLLGSEELKPAVTLLRWRGA